MKINEKTLVSYACNKLPPDMEGWLWKRGEVNLSLILCVCPKSWKGIKEFIFLVQIKNLSQIPRYY